jgi:hypothetical protein
MVTSFSRGRSRSTRRDPPTMGKQLVNFITCSCESSAPVFAVLAVFVWLLDLQPPMQSVPITTDVVSSNLDQDKEYNIM